MGLWLLLPEGLLTMAAVAVEGVAPAEVTSIGDMGVRAGGLAALAEGLLRPSLSLYKAADELLLVLAAADPVFCC